MEFTLSMTFTTSNGDKSTISIEGVKENLTQAEASTLMDTIIEKDIFLTLSRKGIEFYFSVNLSLRWNKENKYLSHIFY